MKRRIKSIEEKVISSRVWSSALWFTVSIGFLAYGAGYKDPSNIMVGVLVITGVNYIVSEYHNS